LARTVQSTHFSSQSWYRDIIYTLAGSVRAGEVLSMTLVLGHRTKELDTQTKW
jgi:hypothetical protein